MALSDQIPVDLAGTIFSTSEFAQAVTYTPSGGAGSSINAVVSRDFPLQEPYVRGPETAVCQILVKATDVTNPQFGDTFTIGSDTWEFDPEQGVISQNSYFLIIALRRVD